jgi:hypothetical protein
MPKLLLQKGRWETGTLLGWEEMGSGIGQMRQKRGSVSFEISIAMRSQVHTQGKLTQPAFVVVTIGSQRSELALKAL